MIDRSVLALAKRRFAERIDVLTEIIATSDDRLDDVDPAELIVEEAMRLVDGPAAYIAYADRMDRVARDAPRSAGRPDLRLIYPTGDHDADR